MSSPSRFHPFDYIQPLCSKALCVTAKNYAFYAIATNKETRYHARRQRSATRVCIVIKETSSHRLGRYSAVTLYVPFTRPFLAKLPLGVQASNVVFQYLSRPIISQNNGSHRGPRPLHRMSAKVIHFPHHNIYVLKLTKYQAN